MELNKLCRTCLSASEDMQSLYETCATSTQICCAEMLSTFTPLICCKDDGLSTMICYNCIREVNRCHTFRLKCLESDRVLRKHVPRVIGVAATNITVTNEQTESRNEDSIKLEEDMDEDSRIFEVVSIKNEYHTSSKKEISAKSLKDPLSLTDMQEDMNQELDIVKHDADIDIKIETDDGINYKINHAQENEKSYSCTVCNQSFNRNQYLIIHMRTHSNLTGHTRPHAGEKPYSCIVCDSSFKLKNSLKCHMRAHTEEKPYKCPVCNNSYRHKPNLTIHMRTHTGEKPYSCTVCDRLFKSKNELTPHMRTHTGKKPYSCPVCFRSFRQRTHLKNHMRTHTGEKPYSCTVCDSSFTQSHNLTMHMQTHAGEKPYSCTVCDSSFKLKRYLTSHMQTHTGGKPYPCTECDISFKTKRTLTVHKRRHAEVTL